MTLPTPNREFEGLLDYLKHARGFDFTAYERSSLTRRVEKRMQMVGVEGFGSDIDYLEVRPDEFTALFNKILINVTSFFRDPQAWEHLNTEVLSDFIDSTTTKATNRRERKVECRVTGPPRRPGTRGRIRGAILVMEELS